MNYWRQGDYWGEAEGYQQPNEAELARMRENILRRIQDEPQLPPERMRNPDAAPSGQGCALAFIVVALVVMAFVFFAWWTL